VAAGVEEGADAYRLLAAAGAVAATPPGPELTDWQGEAALGAAEQRLASRRGQLSAPSSLRQQLWEEREEAPGEPPEVAAGEGL